MFAKDVRFKMPSLKPEQVNHFLAHYAPPVLDPFAGGGSIRLEAQRLGLRAYASDLNPVPVLINKALIEIPAKFADQPPVNPKSQIGNLKSKTWQGAEGLAEDAGAFNALVVSWPEISKLSRQSQREERQQGFELTD